MTLSPGLSVAGGAGALFITAQRPVLPALPSRGWRLPALGTSVALHVFLIAALIILPASRHVRRLAQRPAVIVDIVAPAPVRAASTPPTDTPVPTPTAPQHVATPGMVQATRLLAADILNDPVNHDTRAALAGLYPDEQITQLCALEAMEQVAAWNPAFRPEHVETEATERARLTGVRLDAEGAAFYSAGTWHDLAFHCTLSAGRRDVAAFEFAVGEPIPREDWEARGLPDPGARFLD